ALRSENFVALEGVITVKEAGVKQNTWEIETFALEDPTGNSTVSSQSSYSALDMTPPVLQARYNLRDTFCSSEPVGKVRIRAARNEFADFPAAEQQHLPENTVPAPTQFLSFASGLNLG